MSPRFDAADRIDAELANEPMDSTDAAEPIEAMERTEPTDPIESAEFLLQMLRMEFSDRYDQRDEDMARDCQARLVASTSSGRGGRASR